METKHLRFGMSADQRTDEDAFRATVGLSLGGARLEGGAARTARQARLPIETYQGALALRWMDVSDSLGAALAVDVGPLVWNATAWSRTDASPHAPSLTDSGSASGWSLGAELATKIGTWGLRLERDRADLRTLGASEGRVFHDQDWRSVRVGIDATWKTESWMAAATTRQLRLDVPYQGLDRPFVHWNMIPDDVFGRVAGVLEDRSEYLEGSLRLQNWDVSLARRWRGKSISVTSVLGASWTGFDAFLERSTLDVRGLFPSVDESVPCDGSGWIAMGHIRTDIAWNISEIGVIRMGGLWRQPLAGDWNSRLPQAQGPSTDTAPSSQPVDPWGFHTWSLDWTLAL